MPRRTVAAAIAALTLAGSLAACSSGSSQPQASASSTGIEGVKTYTGLSRNHTTADVTYPQSPPVGGDHDPQWLTCTGTVYSQPVRDENAVHSMEHGAVWVTYQPDLPADQVKTLSDLVQATDYSFMSPYPGLSSPVVLTAWGLQLGVDSADDPRVAEFVKTYAHGPQTPEANAPCDGGVMTN